MPGVSRKTIWASGRVSTPWMDVRVVWGLSATMAILAPIKRFSSVDLPELGRPINETKPDFMSVFPSGGIAWPGGGPSRLRGCVADAHLGDAQVVAGQNIDSDTVALDGLARFRHPSEPFSNQAADGGGLDVFLGMEFEQIAQARYVETAGDDITTPRVFLHIGFRLVLVADLAQDHFDEVFHAGQPRRIAVFIHHDDHVGVVLLHFTHQVVDRLGFGNEADGAHQ